jgi:hypothetical protein
MTAMSTSISPPVDEKAEVGPQLAWKGMVGSGIGAAVGLKKSCIRLVF